MHGGDGENARGGILERIAGLGAARMRNLKLQYAGDDLQAVLYPVIDFLEQKFLLPNLRLKGVLGVLELTLLVELAKLGQLREEAHAHVAACGFWVFQEKAREFLVDPEQLLRVLLEGQLRMQHRPVVGGADEGEKPHQMLESVAPKRLAQRTPRPVGPPWLHEEHGAGGDQPVFGLGHSFRPVLERRAPFKLTQDCVRIAVPGRRGLEQSDRLLDALHLHGRIAG